MFGSAIIDVAIGLILVFLLLSLICSAIREAIAGISGSRAKTLARGVRELLRSDPVLVRAFYEHPQIWALYQGEYDDAVVRRNRFLPFYTTKLPSYIPARSFAMALLDMAARGRNAQSALQASPEANLLTLQAVRQNIGNLGNPFVQRLVLSAVDNAQGDIDKAALNIQAWFDAAMDRVSGWYKRRTQAVLFVIGVALTVLMDVDTVRIAKQLYKDPARREAAVAMASGISQENRPGQPDSLNLARQAYARLDSLGLPVAWPNIKVTGFWPDSGQWKPIFNHAGRSFFGWLLTAFAISLGAPFWFDSLNKVMVIRSTVKPHEKSPEEGSEDRQPKDRRGTSPPASPKVVLQVPSGQATPERAVPAGGVPAVAPDFQPQEWATGRPQGGVL
jgi:hypothetical protein